MNGDTGRTLEDDARGLPAGLAAVAACATSLATWQSWGTGSPLAFQWLSLGVVAALAAVFSGMIPLSVAMRNLPVAGVFLCCFCAQFAALLWSPIDTALHPMGVAGMRQFMMMLAISAVLAGALVGRTGRGARWMLVALVLMHVAIGWFILRRLPIPGIDVMMFQMGACEAFLNGQNPYAMRFPDPYPPESSAVFYGPGISVNGQLKVGFPYTPLSLLLSLPAHLLGDLRLASLFSTAASGVLIAAASPGRYGRLAAALLLFSPIWPLVLFLGWTEAHVVLMLAFTWFCYRRGYTRLLPVAFGLLLASKQYMPAVAPLGLLLLPRPWSVRQVARFAGIAVGVAAVITVPFLLWNPAEFINSVLTFQVRQPYRPDALSFLVRAKLTWMWLPFAALLGAVALFTMMGRRRQILFPAAVSASLLLFFCLNKQAFANYYYLVLAGMCIAAAGYCGRAGEEGAPEATA